MIQSINVSLLLSSHKVSEVKSVKMTGGTMHIHHFGGAGGGGGSGVRWRW